MYGNEGRLAIEELHPSMGEKVVGVRPALDDVETVSISLAL